MEKVSEATGHRAARAALVAPAGAFVAATIALVALVRGWQGAGVIDGALPTSIMVPAAAVGVLLAASALMLFRPPRGATARSLGRLAAAATMALGLVIVGQYVADLEAGALGGMLVAGGGWWLQRPSPPTGLSLVLIGASLLALGARRSRVRGYAGLGAAATLVVALTGLVGHAYGASVLYELDASGEMPVFATIAFSALASGVLFADPSRGVAAVWVSDSAGGHLLRRLTPVAFLAPPLLGWLALAAQESGLVGAAFGTALLVVLLIALPVGFIVHQAKVLHALDAEREQLLAQERVAREEVTNILESITDAFYALDRGWRFTYVNREAERLLQRSREELLGRSVWVEFPEAVSAAFQRGYQRAMAEQQTVEFEEYFAPLDAWFEVHAYPSPEGLSVFFRDVTERKRVEEVRARLLESERRFRAEAERRAREEAALREVARALSAAVSMREVVQLVADVAVNNTRAFGAYVERMEVPEPGGEVEVVATSGAGVPPLGTRVSYPGSLTEEIITSGEPEIMTEIGAIGESMAPYLMESCRRCTGLVVPLSTADKVLGALVLLRDPEQEHFTREEVGFVHILGDTAAVALGRVLVVAELRESEERFRAFAENATIAVFVVDEESRIEFANPAGERIFGYTIPEMLGGPLDMLMPEDQRPRHDAGMRRYLETGRRNISWEGVEMPGLTKDGRVIPLEISFGEFVREGRHYFTGIVRDITERKQAEDALRESEEGYRLLADMIPQYIWTTDAKGYHNYFSRRWYDYSGATPEESRGEGWIQFVHPDDRERAMARWRHSLETGEPYTIEYRFRNADGEYRWFLGQALPLRNEAGEIIRWFGTLTDISERKQLEEEREQLLAREREAREEVTNILESITDAFFAVDREWRFTYVNREAERLLQRSREELLGRSVWVEFPEAVSAAFQRGYQRAMAEQQTVEFEEYFAPLDAWFEVHAYPSPEGLSVYFQDMTERKQREEALRESRERLNAIFNQAAAGIAQEDLTGRFVLVNDRFCGLVGRSREEVLRLRVQDVTHPDDLPRNMEFFDQAVKTGRGFTIEKRYIRPDGSVVYVNNAVSVVTGPDGKPEYLLAVAADITDRKRIEELERSNQELQAFAKIASHDLKEPLRKIQTFVSLLTEEYEAVLDETGRHYLERMRSTVDRMRHLIEDLLAYSRITSEAEPMVPVDLDRVVREVVADMKARIEECGGSVEVQPLPIIDADPVQMRQLFQNLIDNALKFRREGVPPVVRVHGEVLHVAEATNGMLFRLQVEDNGIGFDEKYLGQLFMPFRRLHGRDQYPGTGIGLAICRRIAERHGGSVSARSRPGQGSTFTVTLPVHHAYDATRLQPNGSVEEL